MFDKIVVTCGESKSRYCQFNKTDHQVMHRHRKRMYYLKIIKSIISYVLTAYFNNFFDWSKLRFRTKSITSFFLWDSCSLVFNFVCFVLCTLVVCFLFLTIALTVYFSSKDYKCPLGMVRLYNIQRTESLQNI